MNTNDRCYGCRWAFRDEAFIYEEVIVCTKYTGGKVTEASIPTDIIKRCYDKEI